MDNVNVSIVLFALCCIGVGMLIIIHLIRRYKRQENDTDKTVCELFYNQHAFLVIYKENFFEFEKVKELVFYKKKKLFEHIVNGDERKKYIQVGTSDLKYIKKLIEN